MDIILDRVSVIIGGRALLEDTKVKLVYGKKYGLIGVYIIILFCILVKTIS